MTVKRFGLCFFFVYFLLANLPLPFAVIPYGSLPFRWLTAVWEHVVPPVASALFHVHAEPLSLGSGDTLFNYVLVFVWVIVALIAATIWCALDRNPAHYERAAELLDLYVRWVVAVLMIKYGAGKIVGAQFPRPQLETQIQTIAATTPMGIAYVFMGASPYFQVIAGIAEVLSGVLLTIRRTALAGALLAVAILVNVAAMNFCYDIPAKLQVIQLLLLSIAVVVPRRHALTALFATDERHAGTAVIAVRTLVVMILIVTSIAGRYTWQKQYGDRAPRSPLRGIWAVYASEGAAASWKTLVFDDPLFMSIYDRDGRRTRYAVKIASSNLTLTSFDAKTTLQMIYARPEPGRLEIDSAGLHASCLRVPETESALTTRGFHWVNDYPLY